MSEKPPIEGQYVEEKPKHIEPQVLQTSALARIQPMTMLAPVMDLTLAKKRLAEFQEFVNSYLVPGEDWGEVVPGSKKRNLLKPGADKLCEVYGIADTYPQERIRRVEDWTKEPPLFDYEITCVLVDRRTLSVITEGMGSCNSWEDNYRYRKGERVCPQCGVAAIRRSNKEGEGWYCWRKISGCGANFDVDDEAITKQSAEKVVNMSTPTLKNTILKMAKKRAKIDATISATRSSGIFTQDMDTVRTAGGKPDFDEEFDTGEPNGSNGPKKEQAKEQPKGPALIKFAGTVGNVAPVADRPHTIILRIARPKGNQKDPKWTVKGKEEVVVLVSEVEFATFALQDAKGKKVEVLCSEQPGAPGKFYFRIDRVISVDGKAPAVDKEKIAADNAAARKAPVEHAKPTVKDVDRTVVMGEGEKQKEVAVKWIQVTGEIERIGKPIPVGGKSKATYIPLFIYGFPNAGDGDNKTREHNYFTCFHKSLAGCLSTAKAGDMITFEYEPEIVKSGENAGLRRQNIEDVVTIDGREYENGELKQSNASDGDSAIPADVFQKDEPAT